MIPAGASVSHERYGRGRVQVLRHGGYQALVAFDSDLRLWLPTDELRLDLPSPAPLLSAAEASALDETEAVLDAIMGGAACRRKLEPKAERVHAPVRSDPALRGDRLAVEAFRLGIVPGHAARKWTVGREREVSHVFSWLQDAASGSMVVEGAYGSGKTHILEVLRAEALERGWAVAMVGIDPSDAPAGFPKRVYRHAMRDLRVPVGDEVFGLARVLDALSAISEEPVKGHPIWEQVCSIWKRKPKLREAVLAYLIGRPVRRRLPGLPALVDHTTAANVYCHILSGLSIWLTETLGVRGLLLLIDEAEMSKTYRYHYEWSRGVNFFNGLSWVASDDELIEEEELVKKDCYRGARSNLVYSGFLKWPYTFGIPSHLKVVFAFTPGYTRFFQKVHAENLVALHLPPPDALEELFFFLAAAYGRLYGVTFHDEPLRQAARAMIDGYGDCFRLLIKGFVELLDHRRFYPDADVDLLLGRATGVG